MPRPKRTRAVASVRAATAAAKNSRKKKAEEPEQDAQASSVSNNKDNEIISLTRKELNDLAANIAEQILAKRQINAQEVNQQMPDNTMDQSEDSDAEEDGDGADVNLLNILGEDSASNSMSLSFNESSQDTKLDIPYNPTLPIDFAIPQKIKNKIVLDQYVSFAQLLKPNDSEKFTLQLSKPQSGQGPSLSFAPVKNKEFITYNQWTKAFEIFVAIYVKVHPKSAPGLMKYGADIRDLFTTYGGTAWKIYDETFRKWRASSQGARAWPWERTHTEMWLKATSLGARHSQVKQNMHTSTVTRANSFSARNPFQNPPFAKILPSKGDAPSAQSADSATSALSARAHIPNLNVHAPQTTLPLKLITPQTKQEKPVVIHKLITATNRKISLPTPIKVDDLSHWLEGYVNKDYIISGFRHGFHLNIDGQPDEISQNYHNHPSALAISDLVQSKINSEVTKGRTAGPFENPPFSPFTTSPLGAVPKRESGEFRIIHDLSYPKNNSVNSFIAKENAAVTYETLDHFIALLKQVGKGALIAKADIENAFRNIPVHPSAYPLLGMYWNGQYFYDKVLPFGLSTSCKIFESFSTALQWVLINKLNVKRNTHP